MANVSRLPVRNGQNTCDGNLYALIADGKVIDTKRMILTK